MRDEQLRKPCDPLVPKNGEVHSDVIHIEVNGHMKSEEVPGIPPDGGVRAYAVVVASFLTNGLLFGVINSYSVIYTVLAKKLESDGVANFESRAALVGSLAMGVTFIVSPVSGIMADSLGLRLTAIAGGSLASLGLLLSSFVVHEVDALCFTYGIIYGLGASLAYTPSLAILGHYFKKYLGLVNGIVTIGSSVFTVIIPPLMNHMIVKYGLDWMFRVLAALTFGIALCGILFKPIPLTDGAAKDDKKSLLKTIVDVKIWKIIKYRLWAISMPIALFGYFVPYVHIGKYVENNFPDSDQTLPIQCVGVTSGLGRLAFGFLADRPGIDKIMLQQISFYVIGTLTIILPFVPYYYMLVAISLGMGIFDGAFIALIGPIAFELCGSRYGAQAIGSMLGLAALPLSVGPPAAGALVQRLGAYTVPFVLAGCSPLVGATLMFAARFCGRRTTGTGANGYASHSENGTAGLALNTPRVDEEISGKRNQSNL